MNAKTLFVGCLLSAAPLGAQQLAVRGRVVHTLEGPPLRDGVVLIEDRTISAIGSASEVAIPEGWRVVEAAVVTPGLIDAHSVVGLAGWLNTPHDQEQLDGSEPMQPELRARDAYNPSDPLIAWVRSFGVTSLHTGHAPGALVAGQTMVVKTRGRTVDEALVADGVMVAATLGEAAQEGEGAPGTRAKAAALLRGELIRAREYRDARARDEEEPPARDLRLEVLSSVLEKKRPLLVTAHRAQDIVTALRLAEEFGFDLVLDGGAEVPIVMDQVREAGVPVLLHPPMARAFEETENLSMESGRLLHEAGIPFALQSGYESYVPKTRVVLFEAAIAARYGLPFENALASITRDAAAILGLSERLGTLAVGKDADLALFDGDPFEYTTHCVGVVIEGRVESEKVR